MSDDLIEEIEGIVGRVLDGQTANDDLSSGTSAWAELGELGFLGLEIAEEHGGGGMGFAEVAAVLGPAGRRLSPLPFLSTVVLGAAAIAAVGTDDQRRQHLPAVATGSSRIAVAIGRDVERSGRLLHGRATHVLDATAADLLVVEINTSSTTELVLVPRRADGIRIEAVPTHDLTRNLGTIHLDGVSSDYVELLPDGDAQTAVGWLLDRAAVALSVDSAAGARRVLEIAVDYAKDREQFGRPVGSFQAIKHQCADMLMAVETSAVVASAATRDLPDRPGDRSRWAAIAKAHATDAYSDVAGTGVFVHGGIGFTWEHDMHRYLKRAKLNRALFGSPAFHRERHAAMLLGSGAR